MLEGSILINCMDSGARLSGFATQLCLLQCVTLSKLFNALCLGFLIYKMEKINEPTSDACC